jgi:hypothetical protein
MNGLPRIACALLVAASVAACTPAAPAAVPSPGSSAAPPSAEPSVSPSTAPSADGGIPAGALLQPADVGGAEQKTLEAGEHAHLRPLRPCGDGKAYPSDDTRTAAVAVSYFMETDRSGPAPTVVTEFVGRHTGDGAADQFDEISAALDRCPGSLGENKRRWTVLDTGVAGDESVLVRIDETFSYADEDPAQVSDYAAVARTGDLIVVVTDLGWENIDSSEKLVRDLITKAVDRAGAA